MTDEKKPPLSRPIDDSVPEETPSLLERDVKLDRRAQVPSFAELQGTQRASAPPGLQPRAPARPPTGAPGAVAPAVQLRPPVATTTAAVGTPMLPDA
ncbi:MAG: hypothetical protein K1X89_31950, partial [Myxococcaceae bacterium]|nr:hypothetical protein [Myxococcaceae bacterium]